MKVSEFGARLTRCDQDATVYVIENGVRYLCTLVNAKGNIYIISDRANHIKPGTEIVATAPEVSQGTKNPEN